MNSTELRVEKKYAIKAAEELMYSRDTIDAIKKAKDSYEISRILMKARNNGG